MKRLFFTLLCLCAWSATAAPATNLAVLVETQILALPGETTFTENGKSLREQGDFRGVLPEERHQRILQLLAGKRGVVTMARPRLTAKVGEEASITVDAGAAPAFTLAVTPEATENGVRLNVKFEANDTPPQTVTGKFDLRPGEKAFMSTRTSLEGTNYMVFLEMKPAPVEKTPRPKAAIRSSKAPGPKAP